MYNYTFFSQMDCVGCHFRVFFSGEFIYKLKNTIKWKKCGRTKALLGTYALLHMKLTLFSGSCSWVSFLGIFFYWEFIPIVKNPLGCKSARALSTFRHFSSIPIQHIFPETDVDGCHFLDIFQVNSFVYLKMQLIAKSARAHNHF